MTQIWPISLDKLLKAMLFLIVDTGILPALNALGFFFFPKVSKINI